MNVFSSHKTTNFRLFNLTIFSIEAIQNDIDRDTDFEIVVKQDYFDSEFITKKPSKEG